MLQEAEEKLLKAGDLKTQKMDLQAQLNQVKHDPESQKNINGEFFAQYHAETKIDQKKISQLSNQVRELKSWNNLGYSTLDNQTTGYLGADKHGAPADDFNTTTNTSNQILCNQQLETQEEKERLPIPK